MQRRDNQMPCFGGGHSGSDRIKIPHLSKKDNIRGLTQTRAQSSQITFSIYINFPLAYDTLFISMQILYRVFNRNDVGVSRTVYRIGNICQSS
jgi:hypothetical protein